MSRRCFTSLCSARKLGSPAWLQFPKKYGFLYYSTATAPERFIAPRTSVKNPGLHSQDHLGLWYTIEPDVVKRLLGTVSFTTKYVTLCQTFQETSVMVRKPALTAMDYIKRSNLSLPPNKFMFYGRDGVGKTMTLVHVLHFLAEEGWLIVHVPWAPLWRRKFKEVCPSNTIPGGFDHPVDAAAWLQHFRSQNIELLRTLQLETSEQYTWSRREATEVGSPLTSLVDHGINRTRYATDATLALTTELKKLASEGRCKIALVVDGINSFFSPVSRHKVDHVFVDPQNFTIHKAFTHFFDNDWKNGCIIGSIDKRANHGSRRDSHLPRYLLRQAGWEALDPFIPIPVEDYDDKEMRSILDYYVEHEWLQTISGDSLEAARQELAAYSNHNPQTIMDMCASL